MAIIGGIPHFQTYPHVQVYLSLPIAICQDMYKYGVIHLLVLGRSFGVIQNLTYMRPGNNLGRNLTNTQKTCAVRAKPSYWYQIPFWLGKSGKDGIWLFPTLSLHHTLQEFSQGLNYLVFPLLHQPKVAKATLKPVIALHSGLDHKNLNWICWGHPNITPHRSLDSPNFSFS